MGRPSGRPIRVWEDERVADPAVCPFEVERPVMRHWWERLTFLHWPFEPEAVQRLLPPGLTVETARDAAWVGLVPFHMKVAAARGPSIPWLSRFPETNVRTYVRDEHGRSGIWFFSLEASRLAAVVTARVTYRLPYFWARMRIQQDGEVIRYSSRRRWPDRAPTSDVTVRIAHPYRPGEATDFEHWLTARWILFSVRGDRRRFARAHHAPWPLFHAEVVAWRDELVVAAGLPMPTEEPIAHYSPGVEVRIGRPELEV